MNDSDFGACSPSLWRRLLIQLCQAIPFNDLTRRLLFVLRKPLLIFGTDPIDVTIGSAGFRLFPALNLSDKRLLCTPAQLDGIERSALAERLPHGSHVIDLGANIGGYSILLACARTDLQLTAVEADPLLAVRLKNNIAFSGMNDRIEVLNVAVADIAGSLLLKRHDVNQGQATMVDASAATDNESMDRIAAITLLDVMDQKKIKQPGLVKLDIEGYEYKVLNAFFQQVSPERWPLFIQLEQFRATELSSSVKLCVHYGYRLLKRTRMNVILER